MDHGIGKGNDNSSKEAKGTTPKGHPEKIEPRRLILKKKTCHKNRAWKKWAQIESVLPLNKIVET